MSKATHKSTNISWHAQRIDKAKRRALNGHDSKLIWLTGLSASGKSTIAQALDAALYAQKKRSYVLDGDNIRHGLNKNLGFSPEDRAENIRRIGEVTKLFVDAGLIVIAAFISPYAADRDALRFMFEQDEFIEVFVKAEVSLCEQRDPKGLYKKARAGEIKNFTGLDAPYEKPKNPELILDTGELSVAQCVARIMDLI